MTAAAYSAAPAAMLCLRQLRLREVSETVENVRIICAATGCQNKTLTNQLPGAPNFRQVLPGTACCADEHRHRSGTEVPLPLFPVVIPHHRISSASDLFFKLQLLLQVPELPVYGCAIPTVSGLRQVLDALGAGNGEAAVKLGFVGITDAVGCRGGNAAASVTTAARKKQCAETGFVSLCRRAAGAVAQYEGGSCNICAWEDFSFCHYNFPQLFFALFFLAPCSLLLGLPMCGLHHCELLLCCCFVMYCAASA